MDTIYSAAQTVPDRWDPNTYARETNMVQANRISASTNTSKDITIFTDEGDKVTLSYDRHVEATYADLKALTYQGAVATAENRTVVNERLTRLDAEQFRFEDSQNLTISVEGDLNEQERADIEAALAQIDEIMMHLLQGGDMGDVATEMAAFKDLGTLSSLEADYRYEREISLERYAAKAVNTTSEYQSPEEIYRERQQSRPHGLERLIDRMAQVVEDAKVKPRKFINPVRALFAEISHGMDKENPGRRVGKQTVGLIESELMKRIETMAVHEESSARLRIRAIKK